MTIPRYIRDLRAAVGTQRLIQVGGSSVIRDGSGRVLLVRRGDSGQWALPAGIMEMDEAIAQTIVREVQEETGLLVEPLRLVGLYTDPALQNMTYPHGDQVHVVNATFECRVIGGELCPDGDETIELAFFPPDALPELRPADVVRIEDALSGRREAYYR